MVLGHLVSKQSWGAIDFDDVSGRIFVQEDWLYRWRVWAGVTQPWTYQQQRATHQRIDRSIWAAWSNRFRSTFAPEAALRRASECGHRSTSTRVGY